MSTIILKKSSVSGKVPLVGDLVFGELALNYADGKLYYKTSGNLINYIANGGTFTTALSITSSTQATSTTTGALIVTGGAGIGRDLWVGGVVTATTFIGNLTGTASTSTAAATAYALANTGTTHIGTANQSVNATNVNGGTVTATIGQFSGITTVTNTTQAISTITGAFQVIGGVGIGGSLYVGGTTATIGQGSTQIVINNLSGNASINAPAGQFAFLTFNTQRVLIDGDGLTVSNGSLFVNATTAASSTNTGALQVKGGVGIGGNVAIGGALYAGGTTGTNNQLLSSTGNGISWTSTLTVDVVNAASNMGINGINSRYGFSNNAVLTGGTTVGSFNASNTIQSDVTVNAYGVLASMNTQAASFTLSAYRAFSAGFNTVGVGSTITNAYGFSADSSLGTAATNAYGLYSGIASGASKWNVHAAGTAQNWFAGNVGIGTGKSVPSVALDVAGTVTATNVIVANTLTISGVLSAGGTTGTNGQVLISTGNGVSWTTLSSSFNGGTITGSLTINNSTGVNSTQTGALQVVNGGVGIGGGLFVGGTITATQITINGFAVSTGSSGLSSPFSGIFTITNTTAASSTSTGALQVRGGVGIGGNLYAEQDGYFNGIRIGRGNGSISTNLAAGSGALDTNTTGTNNIAVGYLALNSNETGANNVAVGHETMFGTTNAFAGTALGARALQNISSGQYNIGIGYNAGNSITTGNGNTIIGSVSGTAGLSGTVIIAAGTTERLRVDGSNLYINGTIFTGGGGGGITQGQAVAISMGMAMP
jgi:hypothetical protein